LGIALNVKLCFAQKTATPGDIPLAKLELGAQVRSQAGAWEREEKRRHRFI
jgi:hypothetical protein